MRIYIAHKDDNVATVFGEPLTAGERFQVDSSSGVTDYQARDAIPTGHKIAIREIAEGDSVIKYGYQIGRTTRSIASGEHVHVHNVESLRGRGDLAGNEEVVS